jgi:hypothetical protein
MGSVVSYLIRLINWYLNFPYLKLNLVSQKLIPFVFRLRRRCLAFFKEELR